MCSICFYLLFGLLSFNGRLCSLKRVQGKNVTNANCSVDAPTT